MLTSLPAAVLIVLCLADYTSFASEVGWRMQGFWRTYLKCLIKGDLKKYLLPVTQSISATCLFEMCWTT